MRGRSSSRAFGQSQGISAGISGPSESWFEVMGEMFQSESESSGTFESEHESDGGAPGQAAHDSATQPRQRLSQAMPSLVAVETSVEAHRPFVEGGAVLEGRHALAAGLVVRMRLADAVGVLPVDLRAVFPGRRHLDR